MSWEAALQYLANLKAELEEMRARTSPENRDAITGWERLNRDIDELERSINEMRRWSQQTTT